MFCTLNLGPNTSAFLVRKRHVYIVLVTGSEHLCCNCVGYVEPIVHRERKLRRQEFNYVTRIECGCTNGHVRTFHLPLHYAAQEGRETKRIKLATKASAISNETRYVHSKRISVYSPFMRERWPHTQSAHSAQHRRRLKLEEIIVYRSAIVRVFQSMSRHR